MQILILHPIASQNRRYGTEIVAHELAEEWLKAGHLVTLVGHGPVPQPTVGQAADGVPLITLPKLVASKWTEFRMRTDEVPGLAEAIDSVRPELAVVVGLGPTSANLRHLEILREHGIPCVLWHHVPGITCLQKGLRYKNQVPCDGKVDIRRCTRCRLTAAGVPEPVADLASYVGIGGLETVLPRGIDHIVSGLAMTRRFSASLASIRDDLDLTFVGAEWVRHVLEINGFEPDRIALVRPGVRHALIDALDEIPAHERGDDDPLRLAYWGRLDDVKGVDTAIDAVRSLKSRPLIFDIVGSIDLDAPFHRRLVQCAADDPRITFHGHLPAMDLARILRAADVAIIPSPWLETGPLTVFEAHAAGLPILGARTGGIAEICRDDPSAMLFERGDAAGLARLIERVESDRGHLRRMRQAVPRPRTMRRVAAEMLAAWSVHGAPSRANSTGLRRQVES
jgi:glycosyltransferase involved in cell wall biosynthesis